MSRYKLILEYNGAGLIGFQKNRQGPSVQSLVEDAVFQFSGERTMVVPCGRTDAGVHAIAMPAHFDLSFEPENETVKKALNFYLADKPVSVVSCEVVADDWHARFSCVRRHYKYVIANQDFSPVLGRGMVYWVPQVLDVEAMRRAAERLIGEHDFTSFRAKECQAKSPIKTLDSIEIYTHDTTTQDFVSSKAANEIYPAPQGGRKELPAIISIDFSARSFLHHQVRNIVGTLIEIGKGKPFDIDQIFEAKDRAAAGPTAPAAGLFFVKADY